MLLVVNMYLLVSESKESFVFRTPALVIAMLTGTLGVSGVNLAASVQMFWRKKRVLGRLAQGNFRQNRSWVVVNRKLLYDGMAVLLNLVSFVDPKFSCVFLLYLIVAYF